MLNHTEPKTPLSAASFEDLKILCRMLVKSFIKNSTNPEQALETLCRLDLDLNVSNTAFTGDFAEIPLLLHDRNSLISDAFHRVVMEEVVLRCPFPDDDSDNDDYDDDYGDEENNIERFSHLWPIQKILSWGAALKIRGYTKLELTIDVPLDKLTLDQAIAFGTALREGRVQVLEIDPFYFNDGLTVKQGATFAIILNRGLVTTLILDETTIENFTPEMLETLGSALATSPVKSLSWRRCIAELTQEQWVAFGKMLKTGGLTSLNMSENGFGHLSAWSGLCMALSKNSQLTELEIFNSILSQLTPEGWELFGDMLATTPIDTLDISYNYLWNLTAPQWVAFDTALKKSNVKKLIISFNGLLSFTPQQLSYLGSALKGSKVKELECSLDFSAETVRTLTLEQLSAFSNAIQESPVEILTLVQTSLGLLSTPQLQALGSGFKESHLQTLNLVECELGSNTFSSEQAATVASLLKDSNITAINFSGPPSFHATPTNWTVLGDILIESPVVELGLSMNYLANLPDNEWPAMGETLHKSKIAMLRLTDNRLRLLTPEQWTQFGAVLKYSHLTSLDLSGCKLDELTLEQWEALGNALEGSPVDTLHLANNCFDHFTSEQWAAMGSALRKSNVTAVNFTGDRLHDLTTDRVVSRGIDVSGNKLETLEPKQWTAFCNMLKDGGIRHCMLDAKDCNDERRKELDAALEYNALRPKDYRDDLSKTPSRSTVSLLTHIAIPLKRKRDSGDIFSMFANKGNEDKGRARKVARRADESDVGIAIREIHEVERESLNKKIDEGAAQASELILKK